MTIPNKPEMPEWVKDIKFESADKYRQELFKKDKLLPTTLITKELSYLVGFSAASEIFLEREKKLANALWNEWDKMPRSYENVSLEYEHSMSRIRLLIQELL